jgi:hypothetical protein
MGLRAAALRHFCTATMLGASAGATFGGNSGCPGGNCAVDLDFASQSYQGCGVTGGCIEVRRPSMKWAGWRDGHVSSFANDVAAITDLGLLVEERATNLALQSRDCSQSPWVKRNASCALTAAGVDNQPNSASLLQATGENASVCQSVSASAPYLTFSVFLRRRSGSGAVEIAADGGKQWLPVGVSGKYERFTVSADASAVANHPGVCIRMVNAGDALDVDFAQLEGTLYATSPILTAAAAATRQGDDVTLKGAMSSCLGGRSGSGLFVGRGVPAGRFRYSGDAHLWSPGLTTNTAFGYVSQYDAKTLEAYVNGSLVFAKVGAGTLARPFSAGIAWDPAGTSVVVNNGAVATTTKTFPTGGAPFLNAEYNGYVSRVSCWTQRLADPALAALTTVDDPVVITDAGLSWTQYAADAHVSVSGSTYSAQGGTDQRAIQVGPFGKVIRFNMLADNPWYEDSFGVERAELAGSKAYPEKTPLWVSYSFYVEPGQGPVTTNWFILGQWGQVGSSCSGGTLGPPYSQSLRIGEIWTLVIYPDDVCNGKGKSVTPLTVSLRRGVWYNVVHNVRFDPTGGSGFMKLWLDGKQVVNYTGSMGYSTSTGYYWKFGIYRSVAGEHEAVRYANMTVGTADLSAKIAKPDPIPEGYCYCVK